MAGLTLPLSVEPRQWASDRCDCCPYGYHIHLDFVRYCENLALVPPSSPTPSELRRKRRRRQRQSMEVLLGLLPPMPQTPVSRESYTLPSVPASPVTPTSPAYSSHEDIAKDRALEEAVKDFESTLERSYKRRSTNQTISPSPIRLSLTQYKDTSPKYYSVSEPEDQENHNEEEGHSTSALQNIRRHMAYSLRRVRELEDQIKIIPKLQMQICSLEEEKKDLQSRIRSTELQTPPPIRAITPMRINLVSLNSLNGRTRSSSLTEKPATIKNTRDAEVMCSVVTRNVGITTQSTRCRTLGVGNDSILPPAKPISYNISVQTELKIPDVMTRLELQHQLQCLQQKFIKEQPIMKTIGLQTSCTSKNVYCQATPSTRSTPVEAIIKPLTTEVSVEAKSDSRNVGCNTSFVDTCTKCEEQKKIDISNRNGYNNSVSLSLLNVIKDNPLVVDSPPKLKTVKNFGVQVSPLMDTKQTQSVLRSESKGTQQSVSTNTKSQQYDLLGVTKGTDTENLIKSRDQYCNTSQPELVDASCGESIKPHVMISCADNYCDTCKELIKSLAKGFATTDVSRIPRPTGSVASTKARSVIEHTSSNKRPIFLNNLEINKPLAKSEDNQDTLFDNHKFEATQSTHTSENVAQVLPVQTVPREKSEPSKEMRAALKVLNDSGKKSPKGFGSSYLRNVNTIIQKEWFMISSERDSDHEVVSDYLEYFKNISNELLEYIVNITDATGNTAMHYAVSHGNFEMVSVLLNSGVCDINQANCAGYTSVMLVSLAELVSTNHKTVVKRLFQMADINLPAKQHGQTALMLAVSHGRYDMVNMLLETGADINIQDEDGSTALMCAAEHGHANIVKLFLAQPECDSSIVDVDGSNALKIALEAGHKDIGVMLYAHERKSRTSSPHGSMRSQRHHSSSVPSSPVSPRRNAKSHK